MMVGGCHPDETNRSSEAGRPDETAIRAALESLTGGHGNPQRALSGLAVAVLKNGEVRFEGAFGRARIGADPNGDVALTPESLVRVASISKLLSAIVVMQLVDEGILDLDRDVSEDLGWVLRNPHYPDRVITLRRLLSHTSSIRDTGESYIVRYPRALADLFDPSDPNFEDRFQPANGEQDRGPGVFFEYSNLNYGIVGTILERATGVRFDRLMHARIYEPLGLAGGFNPAAFPPDMAAELATLYRKRDADERWHPDGPWVAQVDDPASGFPTGLPEGARYEPGTNGAQFSPQGGARLSLRGLERLAGLLLADGQWSDATILAPGSMEALCREVWHYDRDHPNHDGYDGSFNAYAAGPRIITGRTPEDRLIPGDERPWVGHFGEAYGFLGGVWVQRDSGDGLIWMVTGTAFDPHEGEKIGNLDAIEAEIVGRLTPFFQPNPGDQPTSR